MLYSARVLEHYTPVLHRTLEEMEVGLVEGRGRWAFLPAHHEVPFLSLGLYYGPALCLTNTHCVHGFVESTKYSDLFYKYELSLFSQ